ncbi:MAG: o-succinylbenzoate--CoA ligase [Thermoleophilaceae bacterium]
MRTLPERVALICGGEEISYAELGRRAEQAARGLAARGVEAGDRVATTLPPGVDFAALLHAVPMLGASIVPLNTRLSEAERRWQLEDSRARLLVDEPLAGDEAEVALRDTFDPRTEHSLIYTSGTTTRPRGVSLTHGNHTASAIANAWNIGVDPGDRWLCVLPLFHVGGLAILIRSALYGTAALVRERFDVDEVRADLEEGRATVASLVSTMLRRLAEAGLERAPALRAALLGGGPVPRDLLEWAARRGLPVLQTYGMTETASQIATLRAEEALELKGSAGRPLLGVEISTSPEGEILARGPMIAPGAVEPDGWLHTGDRGRLDQDGYVWVEGRLKDVIVTGGENVSCAEVEEALLAHPAVTDAGVAAEPDEEWGEVVSAFVVANDGVSAEDLIAHCRTRLASYKAPRRITIVEALPRNAAGKLLRRDLPVRDKRTT